MQLRPHQQRAFAAMQENNAGQIIIPTGGGKTYIMIADAINQLKSGPKTIVVVAPRILLANQLCERVYGVCVCYLDTRLPRSQW